MKTKWIVLSLVGSTVFYSSQNSFEELLNSEQLRHSKGSKLEILPVKYGATEERHGLHLHGKSLLKISRKAPITLEEFDFRTTIENEVPKIKIILDSKTSRNLDKILSRYHNEHIALLHNGRVMNAPKISGISHKDSLEIAVNYPETFETIVKGRA